MERALKTLGLVAAIAMLVVAGCGQKEAEQPPEQKGEWVQLVSLPMSAVGVDYNVCMEGWRSGEFEVQTGVLKVTADVAAIGESDSQAYGTQDGVAEPWVGMGFLKVGEPVKPDESPDVSFDISPEDTNYEVPVPEQLPPGAYTLHSWGVDANSSLTVWELR